LNVSKMKYGPLSGGLSSGMIAFQLWVGEEGVQEVSTKEIITWMYEAPKSAGPKIVRFVVQDALDEAEMFSLVKTIKDWGYLVQVVVDGEQWHPWMGEGTYIIVHVHDPLWLGFGANELWFEPKGEETIADPVLPGGKIDGTLYYLIGKGEDIWPYLMKSKIPWGLLSKVE